MKKILILCILILCFCQLNLCFALNWKNLHEEADRINLSSALAGVELKPDSIDDLYTLGLVYLNLHKDNDAYGAFSKIISLDPKMQEAVWGFAEVLRRQHRLQESEELINDVIKSNPRFSPAYISLAYIKYMQNNFDESIRLAYRVIKQGKDNVDLSNFVRAHLIAAGAKGIKAYRGGPISKLINGLRVLPMLRKAEGLQPDSAPVMLGLGSFYLLAPNFAGGDIDKALLFLERAIKADPLLVDAYVRLAQLYKIRGDIGDYNLYLEKAEKLDPQNELVLDVTSGKCSFICIP